MEEEKNNDNDNSNDDKLEDIHFFLKRFKTKKYAITKVKDAYNVIINDGKKNCVDMTIYIDANDMHINHIDKCKFYNGTQIIHNIIDFAKEMQIKKISLQDKSSITINRCEFPLSYYYILINGMSWYNRFGFVSKNFEEEQIVNSRIPNMTLNEFKMELLVNYNQKRMQSIQSIQSMQPIQNDSFEQIINIMCLNTKKEMNNELVQYVMNSSNIKELMLVLVRNINNDDTCLFFKCILFLSSKYLIKYTHDLAYNVEIVGGYKKKTNR